MTLRPAVASDRSAILAVINAAAQAYRGVIPDDRWHEPYMSAAGLDAEIDDGVEFSVGVVAGATVAVMGIQDRGDVMLIRHAYVFPTHQRTGVGSALLRHLEASASKPMLVGTWAAAGWAIDFYRRHGYALVDDARKDSLLQRYWKVPQRQVETSVVLARADYPPRP